MKTEARYTLKVEGKSDDGVRSMNEYQILGHLPSTPEDVRSIARDIVEIKSAKLVKTETKTVVTETKIV